MYVLPIHVKLLFFVQNLYGHDFITTFCASDVEVEKTQLRNYDSMVEYSG